MNYVFSRNLRNFFFLILGYSNLFNSNVASKFDLKNSNQKSVIYKFHYEYKT
jgi:hypothetical protein